MIARPPDQHGVSDLLCSRVTSSSMIMFLALCNLRLMSHFKLSYLKNLTNNSLARVLQQYKVNRPVVCRVLMEIPMSV